MTHVLSFTKLDELRWPVRLLWSGGDRFLNRAWGRSEPFYLYRLEGARGAAYFQPPQPEAEIEFDTIRANTIALTARSPEGGTLVLTELAFPGWQARIDGEPVDGSTAGGAFRALPLPAGEHRIEWRYRPRSFFWGLAISAAAALLLAAAAHIRFWYPHWTGGSERTS